MDFNKAYKALYLYHEEGYSNYKKIASEADIESTELVKKVIEGRLFKSIQDEFKQDTARGDFGRTYPIPEPKNLSETEYDELKDRYLSRLMSSKNTIEDIRIYLILDDVEPKQATKMLGELTAIYNSMYEDMLDNKLFAVLDVLNKPTKWGMDAEGIIITVYPHPVLSNDYKVKGIEYKSYKSYEMPELLLDRYIVLQDEIDVIEAKYQKSTSKKKEEKRGRKSKYSAELIQQWKDLRQSGMSCRAVSEQYNVPYNIVSYHTNKAV
ncbi:hypothetical protein [Niallia taxi]|uniref:Resolvase n=1 Tax=Niallia taxi TaxID=2499688 RepID=A0A437K4N2_9BACI|nr:hypothetical protein [Niallia taxi]RVT57632.1 hypothetical protein EM808_24495 [Niallia taxi]